VDTTGITDPLIKAGPCHTMLAGIADQPLASVPCNALDKFTPAGVASPIRKW
jgi:hypothetical protein